MIRDGKVRFSQVRRMTPFLEHQRAELEKEAQYWHWDVLGDLFNSERLAYYPSPRFLPSQSFTYLVEIPPPGRPLTPRLHFAIMAIGYIEDPTKPKERSTTRRRLQTTSRWVPEPESRETSGISLHSVDLDAPLCNAVLQSRHVYTHLHRPYHRQRFTQKRLLHGSDDDSEDTISSHGS